MRMLQELGAEMIGMFVGDLRLTLSVLAVIAATVLLIRLFGLDPLVGGAVLLLGCPALLVENVRRSAAAR